MASSDDIASLKVVLKELAAALEGLSLKLAAEGKIEYSKLPWLTPHYVVGDSIKLSGSLTTTTTTNTTQFGNNEATNGSIANNYCQKSSTTLDAQQVFDEIPEPNAQSQSAQKVLDELPIPTFILEMAQAAKAAELDSTRGDYKPQSDMGVLTPNRRALMSASCAMEKPLYNSGRDKELEGIDDSDSQDEEETMQFSLYSQEKEDAEMHPNANTEGGASLQEDVCHVFPSLSRAEPGTTDSQMPSLSTTEKEITKTLLNLHAGNNATEEDTSKKNIRELVPRACKSSTTASRKSDSATAKFEGFDIRIDSVSTLEKIWQKHGNIVENSVMRNRDIIAMSLESLANMVRILDDTSAQSLSDGEVDYLGSTLSDLKYNLFKVDWLIPSVEKAEKFHKSKPLMESFNNLSQLCSLAKDRRTILLEELAKLDVEESKWKEEMGMISKMIPSYGQVKFDEPIGSGLA